MKPTPSASTRTLSALGAVCAAGAVALSAYAAHGSSGVAQASLYLASVFAFGHGVALAALARVAIGRLGAMSLWLLLAGTLLFSGALVSKHVFGISLGVAPFGGTLLICAWLLYAVAALRR